MEEPPHHDECETGLIFQDDLNEVYSNKPVQVFYIYSWFFTNYLVFMTYCGSMPLMFVFGILHFWLAYLSYKFLFVWYNRATQGFDVLIPLYSVKLMKWGLLLHLLFNTFMFTNKRLLSPTDYTLQEFYRPRGEAPGSFFSRRFDIFPSVVVVLVLVGVSVAYLVYVFILVPIGKCAANEIARRKAKNLNDDEDIGDDIEAQELKA